MSFTQSVGFTNLLTGISMVSKGVSAYGQYKTGQTSGAIYDYNARVNEQQAQLTREKTKLDLTIHREESRRRLAYAEAQYAGRGVMALKGSPADVLLQIAEASEMDALIIQFNGDVDALNAMTSAQINYMKARESRRAGIINAGTSLLSAIPDLQKFKFKSQPAPSESVPVMVPAVSGITAFA